MAGFAPEEDPEEFVRPEEELWPEGSGDELGGGPTVVNERSHGGAVLRVQSSVNLIQEVEGGGVGALDGKDEGQGNYSLLASWQLLQAAHHSSVGEGNGHGQAWREGF